MEAFPQKTTPVKNACIVSKKRCVFAMKKLKKVYEYLKT